MFLPKNQIVYVKQVRNCVKECPDNKLKCINNIWKIVRMKKWSKVCWNRLKCDDKTDCFEGSDGEDCEDQTCFDWL